MDASAAKKRILILGGGFAGAYAALHLEKRLRRAPDVEIALLSRENFVLFTPMLHEVSGADVNVTDIVQPLRKMLRHTRLLIADILSIDLAAKRVHARHESSGREFDVAYDHLVVAIGAVTNFYNIPGLQEHALTMKTLGDAILVRNRAIDALGVAENLEDDAERRIALTVVVAGGGFAGIETAGAVNDLLHEVRKFYPNVTRDMVRVVAVHAGDHILPELGERLGRYAQHQLERRGDVVRQHGGLANGVLRGRRIVGARVERVRHQRAVAQRPHSGPAGHLEALVRDDAAALRRTRQRGHQR